MKKVISIYCLLMVTFLGMQQQLLLIVFPNYFPEPVYSFNQNPISNEKISLGRMLFYDPILSRDSSVSCASCHSPYNAFAHVDHALSHGIDDQIGNRNTPALFNLAWKRSFMWDGAVKHLDMQALAPIEHKGEMGSSIRDVVKRLNRSERYTAHFKKAYGSNQITGEFVLKALSQFQLTLVSADAKYDKVKRGELNFSDQEGRGYQLFLQHCNRCHTEPLFTNDDFATNRIPFDSVLNDRGRATVTQLEKDNYLFKVPSLRNLDYTFPYMHDGRFKRLNQVLVHYTNADLNPRIELSDNDRKDLLSFLIALNDTSFIFNTANKYPHQLLKNIK